MIFSDNVVGYRQKGGDISDSFDVHCKLSFFGKSVKFVASLDTSMFRVDYANIYYFHSLDMSTIMHVLTCKIEKKKFRRV